MTKNKNKASGGNPQPTETVVQERPAHIDNGDEARGTVNSRANQTRTQPEPSAAVTAIDTESDTGKKVVALRPSKGERDGDFFAQRHVELSEAMKSKDAKLSEAKQRLAEAADLYAEGDAKSEEAQEAADKAALLLYQARVTGTLSADELSSTLGDQFGFRVKGGTDKYVPGSSGGVEPSKTPYGAGEAIRKRIVRAVQAHEFINGGEKSQFFKDLEPDLVRQTLREMENGETGFWATYERFAALKREAASSVKVELAFDPKRIAQIVEKLQEPGAVEMFINNRPLTDAYVALRDVIHVVGQELAHKVKAA